MKRRLLLFLYGAPNIVGSGLGLLGLALFFAGIIKSYWYFIVPGLYAIGVLVTPQRHTYDLRLSHQLTVAELRDALEELVVSIQGKVAPDVLAKVKSIKTSILNLLPRIADLNSGDYNIHIIRQTALEYLPDTLEHYLNLPRAFAQLHPIKDGKTAKQLLSEQLDLLDTNMKEIVEDFHRNDTQQLLVHGRFLEERFRKSEWWLEEEKIGSGSI